MQCHFSGIQCSLHDLFCWRGKLKLEYFVRFFCAATNSQSLNTQIIMGLREEFLCSRCLSSKKRSSFAVGIDVALIPLYDHDTVEILSQNLLICLNVKSPRTYYSTSHPTTIPANSRLLMLNFPF